jgi:hypothetical protein
MTAWNDTLTPGLLAYVQQVRYAVTVVADLIRDDLEATARRDAPWQDRTGNARRALLATVDVAEDIVTVFLSHGEDIDYGRYLELNHAERFAVIWPTISQKIPDIEQRLQEIF